MSPKDVAVAKSLVPNGVALPGGKLKEQLPQLDVQLFNPGKETVFITAVRVTVLDYRLIFPCGQGGEVEVTGHYGINLPVPGRREQRITGAVSQEVPSNGTNSFSP